MIGHVINGMSRFAILLVMAVSASGGTPARAETSEVRLAKQVGLGSLPLLVMEHEKLFEKQLRAAGLPDTKVSWSLFSSGAVMNDGLLSGNLDFATAGAIPLAVLWSKTAGTAMEVKGVCGVNAMPMLLDTRDPGIKSVRDLAPGNKIALPAIKVSIQAVVLQMAAAKEWGEENYAKLDPLTVSMNGTDSYVALTSGAGEVDVRFGTAPYAQIELKKPGIHTILNSYDVIGGPHDINFIYTTRKFREANPKTYGAFLAAFKEATDFINNDRRRAAEIYLEMSPEHVSLDELTAIISDPQMISSMTPMGVTRLVEFAYKTGTIKKRPDSWKELFFPEAQGLPGN